MTRVRVLRFAGIVGVINIVFGLLTSFLVAVGGSFFAQLHFGLGALFLFLFVLTGGSLGTLKGYTTRRRAGFGAALVLYSTLFVGVLALLNYFVARYDPIYFDSTEQKVFTLAPQTKKILQGLKEKVLIQAFYVGAEVPAEVEDLLNRMAKYSEQLQWKVVDPEKSPRITEELGINERDTLHFSFPQQEGSRSAKLVREIDEQGIVNTLLKLTRGGDKVVYYVYGHGQASLEEKGTNGYLFLREAIEGENIQLKELVLAGKESMPQDAAAIIFAAPRRDALASEMSIIKSYLEQGGSALFLAEPQTTPDIAQLVAPLGIEIGENVILDQVLRLFSEPGVGVQPVVSSYGRHPITEGFSQNTIFSTASSVRRKQESATSSYAQEIAFTRKESWAETDLKLLFSEEPTAAIDPTDLKGPVSLAVAYDGPVSYGEAKSEAKSPSRIVVIGDVDFVSNVNIRQLYNRDFFLNSINWVVGHEQGVSIRARTMRASTERISEEQFRAIFLSTAMLLPELVLVCGLAVWWWRKEG